MAPFADSAMRYSTTGNVDPDTMASPNSENGDGMPYLNGYTSTSAADTPNDSTTASTPAENSTTATTPAADAPHANPVRPAHEDVLIPIQLSAALRWNPLTHELTFDTVSVHRGGGREPNTVWPESEADVDGLGHLEGIVKDLGAAIRAIDAPSRADPESVLQAAEGIMEMARRVEAANVLAQMALDGARGTVVPTSRISSGAGGENDGDEDVTMLNGG